MKILKINLDCYETAYTCLYVLSATAKRKKKERAQVESFQGRYHGNEDCDPMHVREGVLSPPQAADGRTMQYVSPSGGLREFWKYDKIKN